MTVSSLDLPKYMLSVDIGLNHFGYAWWIDGKPFDVGSIDQQTPSGRYAHEKMKWIIHSLDQKVVFLNWNPIWVVWERPIANFQASGKRGVGARPAPANQVIAGDLKIWALSVHAKIKDYHPATIKSKCGNARTKEEVQIYVKDRFALKVDQYTPDAMDALAVGDVHLRELQAEAMNRRMI